MKRYLLFGGYCRWTRPGWAGFVGSFDSVRDATEDIRCREWVNPMDYWAQIIDAETEKVVWDNMRGPSIGDEEQARAFGRDRVRQLSEEGKPPAIPLLEYSKDNGKSWQITVPDDRGNISITALFQFPQQIIVRLAPESAKAI